MRHFYHVFCGGPWEAIAAEHIEAMGTAPWELTVGLIGAPVVRAAAKGWWLARTTVESFVEADEGFEQVTLWALHDWAKQAPAGEPVLYAHSKGVTHRSGDGRHPLYAGAWRASMTRHVVGGWQRCTGLLQECDAVGCHWLTPETYPGLVQVPYFAGNFWWARAGYVARLPPVSNNSRYDAEGWVGLGAPEVRDLRPGWPTFGLFAREVIAQLNPGAEVLVS